MNIDTLELAKTTVDHLIGRRVNLLNQPDFLIRNFELLLSDIESNYTWSFQDQNRTFDLRKHVLENSHFITHGLKQCYDCTIYTLLRISQEPKGNALVVTFRSFLYAFLTKVHEHRLCKLPLSQDVYNIELMERMDSIAHTANEFISAVMQYGPKKAIDLYNSFEKVNVNKTFNEMLDDGTIKGGILGMDDDDFENDSIWVDEDLTNREVDDRIESRDKDIASRIEKDDVEINKVLHHRATAARTNIRLNRRQKHVPKKPKPINEHNDETDKDDDLGSVGKNHYI